MISRERRIEMETVIGERLVHELVAAGYEVALEDGIGDFLVGYTADAGEVVRELRSMDEEGIYARPVEGGPEGWILLVYGNAGYGTVCDYTMGLEHVVRRLDTMIDLFADEVAESCENR